MAATAPPVETPGPGAARPRYRVAALVLGLGVASTALLVWTALLAERPVLVDFPFETAVIGVRLQVAESHLWLEEHITGDPDVSIAEVRHHLDEASRLLAAMLEGGPGFEGRTVLRPLRHSVLRSQVQDLRDAVEGLRSLSEQRYREGAGVGSLLDRQYDQAFYRILGKTEALDSLLHRRIRTGQRHSRRLVWALLSAWVLAIALAVVELRKRERRQLRAESALRRSEAQLQQSRKLEALGRLAGGIAHDINNYLAAITSSTELAQLKGPEDPRLADRLQTVLDTAFRASGLLRRVLAFSRRQPSVVETVQANELVAALCPVFEGLPGSRVRLETRLDPELWPVLVDPAQLEQVLLNLLINAREAMPEGGVVRLSGENVELDSGRAAELGIAPGPYIRLAVSDTGVGIEPAIRDQIFDPFFTTKRSGEGTGLGLATVYGVVGQAGGTVAVESQPGQGSTFEVYLPKAVVDPELAATTAGPGPDRSLVVLLVEDRRDVRVATADLLRQLGHRVSVAGDLDEAERCVDQAAEAIDVVVTDLDLPGAGGVEVVRHLRRRHPGLRALYVSGGIVSSGIVSGGSVSGGSVSGGNGVMKESALGSPVLQKPFTARRLAAALRRATG